MFNGYNKIFWGIFIMTFNINIGPIKILPAFIGLLTISSGLNSIYNESPSKIFEQAKFFVGLTTFMSITGEIIDLFFIDFTRYSIFSPIWIILYGIIELIMIYKIFEGSIEYLNLENYLELAEDYIKKLRIYLIVSIVNIIFMCFAFMLNFTNYASFIAIIGVVLRISVMAMISGLKKIHVKEGESKN